MGFLDKVKSSVDNVASSVNGKIDNEKFDYKIREEERKIDKQYAELGKIVFESIKTGGQLEKSDISEPCTIILASLQEINMLTVEKGEEPDDLPSELDFEGALMLQGSHSGNADVSGPEMETTAPAEEGSVEETVEDVPAEDVEVQDSASQGGTTGGDDSEVKWVEADEYFSEPEPSAETQDTVEPPRSETEEPTVAEDVPSEPVGKEESGSDNDSPLSRIQSYQSNRYSGDKI